MEGAWQEVAGAGWGGWVGKSCKSPPLAYEEQNKLCPLMKCHAAEGYYDVLYSEGKQILDSDASPFAEFYAIFGWNGKKLNKY